MISIIKLMINLIPIDSEQNELLSLILFYGFFPIHHFHQFIYLENFNDEKQKLL